MIDMIICGVGGQGIISMGHILAQSCLLKDIEFISSETHGMSQRGGSVIFHFRIGNQKSPLIPLGNAQILLSTEPIEALRNLEYLAPNGVIVSNEQPIQSPIARQLGIDYPNTKDIFHAIQDWPASLFTLNAATIASMANAIQSQNIVLLGAILALEMLPVDKDEVRKIVQEKWPKYAKQNSKAFEMGYNAIKSEMKKSHDNMILMNCGSI